MESAMICPFSIGHAGLAYDCKADGCSWWIEGADGGGKCAVARMGILAGELSGARGEEEGRRSAAAGAGRIPEGRR